MPPQSQMRTPCLVAGWPGMGLVAYKAVDYLIRTLPAEPLDQFAMEDCVALLGIRIEQGVIQPVEPPRGHLFRYAGAGQPDLLLFLGEEQPVSGKEWTFANRLLDEVTRFNVGRIYTFAAMPAEIDHRADPAVWACATSTELLEEIMQHGVKVLREGTISGLNGLLLGVACGRGMGGCCLLGEIPTFMTQIENPRSSGAVIERLGRIIGLSVDLTELQKLAQATEAQVSQLIDQVHRRAATEKEPGPGGSRGETN